MSNTLCKVLENHVFAMITLTFDLVPMTFKNDLDIINVHHHTKFEQPKLNSSRDMNFYIMNHFLVTDGQTEGNA